MQNIIHYVSNSIHYVQKVFTTHPTVFTTFKKNSAHTKQHSTAHACHTIHWARYSWLVNTSDHWTQLTHTQRRHVTPVTLNSTHYHTDVRFHSVHILWQIWPKWDKSGTSEDQFSVHFGWVSQNERELTFKSPRFVPFDTNLAQLEAKSDTLVTASGAGCYIATLHPP